MQDTIKKAKQILKEAEQQLILNKMQEVSQQKQLKLSHQVLKLQKSYPGGLSGYVKKARKLLIQSKEGINPYEGFVPQIPKVYKIDFQSKQIQQQQKNGIKQLGKTAFVLVAGGLGQRLGYPGIKVQLPVQLLTGKLFLQLYIQYLLQFGRRNKTQVQLAIMTSQDTYTKTIQLLQKNKYFGMNQQKVTIMLQQKVPAMLNNKAQFSFLQQQFQIQTKPHGHGDVHTLLYQNKLTQKWLSKGIKWVLFFQDTNPLIFRSIPSLMGLTASQNIKVNSVAVPRKPGQAVGALMKLKGQKRQLTINVQYNQVQSLLSKYGGQKTNSQGNSVYPGNINVLVFSLKQYAQVLNSTKGSIDQFINPKYKDKQKNQFKSATRLQCMMQDYPKLLPDDKGVAVTQISRFFCFSAVKNDIATAAQKFQQKLPTQCAASCQADVYFLNRKLLKNFMKIKQGKQQTFSGLTYTYQPRISISPRFALTFDDLQKKVKGGCQIAATGQLIIEDGQGQRVIVRGQNIIRQKGKKMVQSNAEDPSFIKIRGFKLQ